MPTKVGNRPAIPWYQQLYFDLRKLSLEELRAALDDVAIEVCTTDEAKYVKPLEITRRAERLLHELARRGPEYALDHGFASLAAVAALLDLRLRARIGQMLFLQDEADYRRPEAPSLEGIRVLLPTFEGLTRLQIALGTAYAKFQHVLDITDRQSAAAAARRHHRVDRRPAGDGGASRGGRAAGRGDQEDDGPRVVALRDSMAQPVGRAEDPEVAAAGG
jgi:hypothetical protein